MTFCNPRSRGGEGGMVDAVAMTTRKARCGEGSGTRECSGYEGMKRRMGGEIFKRKTASEKEELATVVFTTGAQKMWGNIQRTINSTSFISSNVIFMLYVL
jgi:hypothetical protein